MGASGILLIVIGVLAGGAMALAPKALWWIVESWKFRHPEANEPSAAAYAVTRVGGAVLVVVATFVGIGMIQDGREAARVERAEQESAAAEAAFVAPAPETRGLLPIIGYSTGPGPIDPTTAYFMAPEDSWSDTLRASAPSPRLFSISCYYRPVVTAGPDGRQTVNVELVWAPQRLADMEKSGGCHLGPKHKIGSATVRGAAAEPNLVTDASIADEDGAELVPAAPQNAVPLLPRAIDSDYARPTASARGRIPVAGYRVGADGALTVSYLKPAGVSPDFVGGDRNRYRGGCEVVPMVTRTGDTVTVDLWLRWTDPGEMATPDQSTCTTGAAWSGSAEGEVAVDIPSGATVLTNGPIINGAGEITQAAAPGNRVPA